MSTPDTTFVDQKILQELKFPESTQLWNDVVFSVGRSLFRDLWKVTVPLLQFFFFFFFFVRLWFHMWRLFRHCLFLISPSFSASGGLCFMIEAFPGYYHRYVFIWGSLMRPFWPKLASLTQETWHFSCFPFCESIQGSFLLESNDASKTLFTLMGWLGRQASINKTLFNVVKPLVQISFFTKHTATIDKQNRMLRLSPTPNRKAGVKCSQ